MRLKLLSVVLLALITIFAMTGLVRATQQEGIGGRVAIQLGYQPGQVPESAAVTTDLGLQTKLGPFSFSSLSEFSMNGLESETLSVDYTSGPLSFSDAMTLKPYLAYNELTITGSRENLKCSTSLFLEAQSPQNHSSYQVGDYILIEGDGSQDLHFTSITGFGVYYLKRAIADELSEKFVAYSGLSQQAKVGVVPSLNLTQQLVHFGIALDRFSGDALLNFRFDNPYSVPDATIELGYMSKSEIFEITSSTTVNNLHLLEQQIIAADLTIGSVSLKSNTYFTSPTQSPYPLAFDRQLFKVLVPLSKDFTLKSKTVFGPSLSMDELSLSLSGIFDKFTLYTEANFKQLQLDFVELDLTMELFTGASFTSETKFGLNGLTSQLLGLEVQF